MSAWNHSGEASGGSDAWKALSGEGSPTPQASSTGQDAYAQPPLEPVHGGWQQPWQDDHGQWHYPYATDTQSVEEPARSPIVAAEQLAPVGPPRYLAPARVVQDPRRRTLAAVITFLSLLVGLWAILAFMGSMSKTLASVSSGTSRLEAQLAQANAGLAKLEVKTGHLEAMAGHSRQMKGLLGTIDSDMGGMLSSVDQIAGGMRSMEQSLGRLDSELTKVNEINAGMSDALGGINSGLSSQVRSVRTMRRDVAATGTVLGTLPGRLDTTNQRLGHVNRAVNIMGCQGITNNLEVDIFLGPFRTGGAKVFATVVPPAAWGRREDGVTPC